MTILNQNISRMIGSYPTSYRALNNFEEIIQKEVEFIISDCFTADEREKLDDMLQNHSNDYFVKAFRRQYTLEKAADITLGEAIYFAVNVAKSVVS